MNTKLTTIITSITIASLLFSVYQPGNAVTYYNGHDGSVEDNITKVKVEQYKGKQGHWTYLIKVCVDDHNIAVASVILKSDIAKKELGVNKTIKKGDCSSFGAVMKAKNGSTLGAELIERHEAIQKFYELINDDSEKTIKQQKALQKEITHYRIMLGGLV